MKKTSFFITGLLATICCTVKAQIIPLDSMVKTGKLANGFTYYIRHNEEPKNRVVFHLANKVGSLMEDEDQRGLAHFIEHMGFNGTKNFPKNELVNYLQKSGVRFGADINAYTSFEETVYQLPLPSDSPEILKNGIEIMHDWAQGATLDPIEINKERGVVLEEKRSKKGVSERMQTAYWPAIVNNSRYAVRMPIGTDEVLNKCKPETIKRFYHDWYRPNLQALIVVGDINVDQMEKTIKEKFSDLKNPINERPRVKYTIPLKAQTHFIAITDPEMTVTTAQVMLKQPALPLHTVAEYRASIVRFLFNTIINQRVRELQRQADPPFLQGSAAINMFIGGLDDYSVTVAAKPGLLEKGFKAVWRETERAKRFGFTGTEMERAKTSFLNRMESLLKEKDKTASKNYTKEYVQYFLDGTASPGIVYEYNLVKNNLAGITVTEINALANTVSKSTDCNILLQAPEKDKAGLPNKQLFISWMKAVEAENMSAYEDQASSENLLKIVPVPGKIISEKKDDKLGITIIMLSNGIKVLLKVTDFKNNDIQFSGFAPGGTSLCSDADYQSANAADFIPSFGAGNYTATQLAKYLSAKQLSVQPFISERVQGIKGSTVNKDLETALQLVYAYITQPRKDSLLFQGILSRLKAGLANRNNDPNSIFSDTVNSVLSNHNIRKTGPSLEKIGQVNLDKAYTFYKERFANNRGFNFVFVGSIDTLTIRPLLEKYLGSLPVSDQIEQARDLQINIPAGIKERIVYKGTAPKATVNLVFSGLFDYSFANKLKMDALREVLQIRLIERLREDESGVYAVSASMSTSKFPDERFNLAISFGCAPQNAEKLIASALDEIDKIKKMGPSQTNVDKFRVENQRTIETNLKRNGFWLNYLIGQLQNNEDLNRINDYSTQLNLVTPVEIKEVANKYVTGKNYIKLVLLPQQIP
jgi:zinc protease